MKLRQLRNATLLLSLGPLRIVVDPMLGEPHTMPGFKLFGGGRRRNPLTALPPEAEDSLRSATDVLVTHEHPDHLDPPALEWIKERELPVWASSVDTPSLRSKGMDARELRDGSLGMSVEVIPVRHGRGAFAYLMGPVSSFYLAHPDEPSVLLTSDAVLTEDLLGSIDRLKPEIVVAPAGSANFGIGPDILFSRDEMLELVRRSPGKVIFNHLEALDHCPTTRDELRSRMDSAGLGDKVLIPSDGQELNLERTHSAPHATPRPTVRREPGFQKWLTAKFAGT